MKIRTICVEVDTGQTCFVYQRKTLNDRISKIKFKKVASIDWGAKNRPWSSNMDKALREVFQLENYRPHQLEAMNAFLSGHDVILVMPTGGGKSLTYQLASLVNPKGPHAFTLVISPLVSLVEDQVMALQALGQGRVNVAALNAATTRSDNTHFFVCFSFCLEDKL